MEGNDYYSYIFELERRKIRGDFEGAYANCEDVWPTQHQLDLPHFVYVKGLVRDRCKALGRVVRVLDLGCGYGDFVHELNSLSECDAVGVEISHSAAKKGRQRFGPGLNVVVGDLKQGLPAASSTFDVILVMGVFQYLLDRVQFCLPELDRVAAKYANLVFTLHLPENPIGKEFVSSYDDFLNLLRAQFDIVDGFKFYQPSALQARKPLVKTVDDVLIRCRRKGEG